VLKRLLVLWVAWRVLRRLAPLLVAIGLALALLHARLPTSVKPAPPKAGPPQSHAPAHKTHRTPPAIR